MKKFYAIFAAALMSISVFAAKDVVPSDAVLADYYDEGKVCMCFFVPADMNCNDIVVTGSFNDWSDNLANCIAVEPVEGYDGWYVTSWEPEAEPDATKGIQAKPVMKGGDGAFNWAYQVGDATIIRGGVKVEAGLPGEIDLINYGTDAPNVFTVNSWKQNPCDAIYHNYTVAVINNTGCDGLAVPFLIGEMTGWGSNFMEMQLDADKSVELGAAYYTYSFKAREGAEFQILSGLYKDGELVATPGWNDQSYLQVFKDGEWIRIPGESGDNLITKENPSIVLDIRDEEQYRWARCAPEEEAEYTVLFINLPAANCPEAVEIIGTFDDWQGTAMEKLETGWFFVELDAKASQYFKFRSAGLWPDAGGSEIEVYDAENDTWKTIGDGEFKFGKLWHDTSYKGTPCKSIGDNDEWDLSDPAKYRWSVAGEGVEDIVLTVKAQKVMVDGVLYIVRDNKLFNVQGAQVR